MMTTEKRAQVLALATRLVQGASSPADAVTLTLDDVVGLAREVLRLQDARAETVALLRRAYVSIEAAHAEDCRYCEITGGDPEAGTCGTEILLDDLAAASGLGAHRV